MFESDTENTFRRSYGTSRAERIEDAASVFCILKYKTAARNDTDYIFSIMPYIFSVCCAGQTNKQNKQSRAHRAMIFKLMENIC